MLNAEAPNRAADLSDELNIAITCLLNLHGEYKGSWQHHEIYHYFPRWVKAAKTKDELSFRVHLFCDYLNQNSTLNSLVAPIPFPIPQLTAATLSWSTFSEKLKKELEVRLAENPNESNLANPNFEIVTQRNSPPPTVPLPVVKGWLDTIKVKINLAHDEYQPRWYGQGWNQDTYFVQMPRLLDLSQDPLELRFLLDVYARYLNQNSTINSTVNLLGSWFPKITQSISGSRLAQTLTDIKNELSDDNIALYTTANDWIHPSQSQKSGRDSPVSLPDLEIVGQQPSDQHVDEKRDSALQVELKTQEQAQAQAFNQEVNTTEAKLLPTRSFREQAKEEAKKLKEAAKAERLRKQEKEKKEKELEKKKKAFEEQQKKEKEKEAKLAKERDKDKELQRTRSNSNNSSAPIDIPLRRSSDGDRLSDYMEEASPSPEIFSSFKKFFKLRSSPPKPEAMETKNGDDRAVTQSPAPSTRDKEMQEATKLHLLL